jgi:hypothetical protein
MRVLARSVVLLLSSTVAAGCSGGGGTQPIAGQLALASFPVSVTAVRASQPGGASVQAPVGIDGRFLLALGAGKRYRIEFLSATGAPVLALPRKTGGMDYRFDVRGHGPLFDVGMVRYVGAPASATVVFKQFQTAAGSGSSPAATTDTDNLDCENGRDKATGAVCADDNSEDPGGACAGEGDSTAGPDEEKTDPPAAVAVADKNIPPAVGGCDGEGEGEGSD